MLTDETLRESVIALECGMERILRRYSNRGTTQSLSRQEFRMVEGTSVYRECGEEKSTPSCRQP